MPIQNEVLKRGLSLIEENESTDLILHCLQDALKEEYRSKLTQEQCNLVS